MTGDSDPEEDGHTCPPAAHTDPRKAWAVLLDVHGPHQRSGDQAQEGEGPPCSACPGLPWRSPAREATSRSGSAGSACDSRPSTGSLSQGQRTGQQPYPLPTGQTAPDQTLLWPPGNAEPRGRSDPGGGRFQHKEPGFFQQANYKKKVPREKGQTERPHRNTWGTRAGPAWTRRPGSTQLSAAPISALPDHRCPQPPDSCRARAGAHVASRPLSRLEMPSPCSCGH